MQDKLENDFKDLLQNYEMSPPPMAWDNISAKLNDKDKNPKVFPWLKWSGIAAALLIPALVGVGIFMNQDSNVNLNQQGNISSHSTENQGNTTTDSLNHPLLNEGSIEQNSTNSNQNLANENGNGLIENENSNSRNDHKLHKDSGSNSFAVIDKIKNWWNDKSEDSQPTERNLAKNKISILSALAAPFYSNPQSTLTEPRLYAMANTNESLQITAINALEEKKEKTETSKNHNKNFKFTVDAYAGPVFLGSFNEASLIAPEFNQLNVSNQTTMAYGSKAGYQINDRVKLKSGVGVIDLRQNTSNVPLSFSDVNGLTQYNIKSNSNLGVNLSLLNQYQNGVISQESTANQMKSNISQQIQIIEVPVEVEYRLTKNRKVNVAATGGLSTLFLNKNDVYLRQDGNQLLGSPTNMKSVSFSANTGVKLDYKITEKVAVNVEPQFKFMINTITGNDEVQPYMVGINAGIAYSL